MTSQARVDVSDGSFSTQESVVEALEHAKVEIETLREALLTRTIIGQATGLLMRDLRLSAEGAFQHLVVLSERRDLKVRDIAAQMVAQADRAADVERTREISNTIFQRPSDAQASRG